MDCYSTSPRIPGIALLMYLEINDMYIKATSDNGIWKRNFYGGSELKQEESLIHDVG